LDIGDKSAIVEAHETFREMRGHKEIAAVTAGGDRSRPAEPPGAVVFRDQKPLRRGKGLGRKGYAVAAGSALVP